MKFIKLLVLLSISYLGNAQELAQSQSLKADPVDVLAYQVRVEPDLSRRYIEGVVSIRFKSSASTGKVVFDSGRLVVTKVEGTQVKGFKQTGKQTIISLTPNNTQTYEIRLFYYGTPRRGLVFLNKAQKMYSVYFTSEWMVCNNAPDDRAPIKLEVLVPKGVISVASGILKKTVNTSNKVLFSWKQTYATPAYTYGFVIGSFDTTLDSHNDKL